MKSKGTAYVLWFFLGLIGVHKFYLARTGMGVLYLLTAGIFGIGWFFDLFTLGGQVDRYNALYGRGQQQSQSQNIIINMPTNGNEPAIAKTE
ncbi:putative membrane protein [Sphaerochaeta pleomorpha str. Grapes]|uniref:Putative membrane protein n=1 Tax=Sphaerochaeta pleomorpha (strain ATCC BAA-1885 / DSM 22778 / Grapes) TaxID=158190 RepID=G8QZ13_SPHPG|nr:TM2 domain-containing protein [Sphaerochaeta pleomorpha]AEV30872.1 putative membrane protein [Sphaerochaeta pleomorpha str. Grapes]